MINILIPLGGKSIFFDEAKYQFSKQLVDINGKPMIELVLEPFLKIKQEKKFIFVVKQSDCDKYHMDNVLYLITENNCEIIRLTNDTQGAACSCLMAIEHIDNSEELIISNADQVIDEDYSKIIESFRNNNFDCALVTFESLHPQWSYIRLDNNQRVIETAEKRPISKNAIAGFYYFKEGKEFVKSALRSIEKDANINGHYYVAPVINEMVLDNKNIGTFKLKQNQYFSFYSPSKIKEFEKRSLTNL